MSNARSPQPAPVTGMLPAVLVTWAGELLNLENGRKVMQDATTMNSRETAKQKIEAALRAIDCALTDRPQAIFEITTEYQLIRFKAVLLKALHLISRGEIPELISHRKLGMARVITDQWP
ncbi:hypothetical protein [Pseudomonas graminis]|uniref:hypothetical protein n=1 Tax=Pseudomonas graminis TaxID=158627 RepID=UPI001113B9C4|nr:hypothetical protein [Pseudomonas graminis]